MRHVVRARFNLSSHAMENAEILRRRESSVSANLKTFTRERPGGTVDVAVRLAMEALYDAADDDTATGGPDLIRKVFPVVMVATAEGSRRLTDEESGAVAEAVIRDRTENPGG